MDQIKIGKFIAECRKSQNMTQLQLAERMNVTDRAVSKWENGKSMPDSSLMLELCNVLKISVTDLLNGENIKTGNYNQRLEQSLIDMVKQKEDADKMLLFLELLVGVVCVAVMLATALFASFVDMEEWQRITLILIGLAPILIVTPFMIKIEQTAGYYECKKCGHKYVPTYSSVFMSMHTGRTRYMRCPKCGKKSWQKKVIRKE